LQQLLLHSVAKSVAKQVDYIFCVDGPLLKERNVPNHTDEFPEKWIRRSIAKRKKCPQSAAIEEIIACNRCHISRLIWNLANKWKRVMNVYPYELNSKLPI